MPIQCAVNRSMDYSITHGGFVDDPWFGIRDSKLVIRQVAIVASF